MRKAPKLNPGQVTILRCDMNTGHVLKTNGELYLEAGEIYQTFDSIDMAEQFISTTLSANPDMEFIAFDHEGKPIVSWDRFKKKRLD